MMKNLTDLEKFALSCDHTKGICLSYAEHGYRDVDDRAHLEDGVKEMETTLDQIEKFKTGTLEHAHAKKKALEVPYGEDIVIDPRQDRIETAHLLEDMREAGARQLRGDLMEAHESLLGMASVKLAATYEVLVELVALETGFEQADVREKLYNKFGTDGDEGLTLVQCATHIELMGFWIEDGMQLDIFDPEV